MHFKLLFIIETYLYYRQFLLAKHTTNHTLTNKSVNTGINEALWLSKMELYQIQYTEHHTTLIYYNLYTE